MRDPRTMPPKSKRKLQLQENLEKAREAKMKRSSGEGTSSSAETDVRTEPGVILQTGSYLRRKCSALTQALGTTN